MLKDLFGKVKNFFTTSQHSDVEEAMLRSVEKEEYLQWEKGILSSLEPDEARRQARKKKIAEIQAQPRSTDYIFHNSVISGMLNLKKESTGTIIAMMR